ncbi:uncharacterized protein N7482_002081 [Penicillium canariense]|uniref:Ketoreductase domain-containing protein n=1 Tax=Penicillium canariense TaxID=189055 RepID=A0A9W9IH66_9EURO|nr:uncharacterized protein N7482_002081 [Penicillium canariense]KAJ5176204.1 hypothetical protein N7482_002081 [Penicillium canariense]
MAAPFPSPTSTWHSTARGSGIGAETARYFAEAGASRIALLGRREQPLLDTKASIERRFPRVEVFVESMDVTNKSQVDAAFANFVGGGRLHVLVSNAAMIGPQDPVQDVESEPFLESIQQNLKGALFLAQAFLRYASTDAVAIEISSSAAHLNFSPRCAAYSISKFAVYRLWDSLASANPNLSIFHLQPGLVDTAMSRETGGVAAFGTEDNVSLPASFNVWLASPEARFLKGKFLWANWDVDELKANEKEMAEGPQLSIGLVGWPFQEANWESKIQL